MADTIKLKLNNAIRQAHDDLDNTKTHDSYEALLELLIEENGSELISACLDFHSIFNGQDLGEVLVDE